MTARFRRTKACPRCAAPVPMEDDVSQEIRNHPELSSADGFCFMDKDLIVHRCKVDHDRSFQCLMFVEIKTNGAVMTPSQTDTMHMVGQLFRSRKTTPTKTAPSQVGGLANAVYSTMSRRWVAVKAFGYHSAILTGPTIADSDVIIWDSKHLIKPETFFKLLRFELDPDTLETLSFRKTPPTESAGTPIRMKTTTALPQRFNPTFSPKQLRARAYRTAMTPEQRKADNARAEKSRRPLGPTGDKAWIRSDFLKWASRMASMLNKPESFVVKVVRDSMQEAAK